MEVGTNVSLALRVRNGHRRAFPNVTYMSVSGISAALCYVLRDTMAEKTRRKKNSHSHAF